jgi:hypothetical protein
MVTYLVDFIPLAVGVYIASAITQNRPMVIT